MTTIYCCNTDCKHYDPKSFTCTKRLVTVGEDYSYGCDDYESYLDSKEYNDKYFIAVKANDGRIAKAVRYGKKIEYNGMVFFTGSRVTEDGDFNVTEKCTGYNAGSFSKLADRWDKLIEIIKRTPDVESYPLAVYELGKYKIVKEQNDET